MRSSYSPHAIFFLAIMALCCFSVETFAQDPVQDGRDKPIFFANEVLRSSLSKQKIADTLACSIHLNKKPSSSGGKVATTANTHERKRPNILFVFSDDHSPNAIGAYDGTRSNRSTLLRTSTSLLPKGCCSEIVFALIRFAGQAERLS